MKTVPAFETPDGKRFFDEVEARDHERRCNFGDLIRTAVGNDAQFARLDPKLLEDFLMGYGPQIGSVAVAVIRPDRSELLGNMARTTPALPQSRVVVPETPRTWSRDAAEALKAEDRLRQMAAAQKRIDNTAIGKIDETGTPETGMIFRNMKPGEMVKGEPIGKTEEPRTVSKHPALGAPYGSEAKESGSIGDANEFDRALDKALRDGL